MNTKMSTTSASDLRIGRFGASAVRGWQTDRGRTYILYGPPDELESHSSGGTYERPLGQGGGTIRTAPFEIWRYRYIEGMGSNIIFRICRFDRHR